MDSIFHFAFVIFQSFSILHVLYACKNEGPLLVFWACVCHTGHTYVYMPYRLPRNLAWSVLTFIPNNNLKNNKKSNCKNKSNQTIKTCLYSWKIYKALSEICWNQMYWTDLCTLTLVTMSQGRWQLLRHLVTLTCRHGQSLIHSWFNKWPNYLCHYQSTNLFIYLLVNQFNQLYTN